ncbi:hypothetical protein GCM10009650_24330 [Nesterenkonia jeotgali]
MLRSAEYSGHGGDTDSRQLRQTALSDSTAESLCHDNLLGAQLSLIAISVDRNKLFTRLYKEID